MRQYDHSDIEKKWQKRWQEADAFRTPDNAAGKENYFFLTEFPYPSGNLHVGHWYAFAVPDIFARYMRMRGYNVMYPIGFDAFGLPAENAAIKRGLNPRTWTYDNMAHMREQIRSMGASFDWSREVITCDPTYYKWTQWQFLELYKKGLVYRKETAVNWCPTDKVVLANEQVTQGRCWRCNGIVEQRLMPQWNVRITDYADRLIDDLDALEWPRQIKDAQRNWIGRSEGAEIDFAVAGSNQKITVFTTRPDTLFGATYMVLAPEHPLVQNFLEHVSNKEEVLKYIESSKRKTELERTENKEKTGVELKGVKAINPANNEEIPIYVADYVLGNYGTGAIMAVPAHDERDGEFAKKYNIPVKQVIAPLFIETHNPPKDGLPLVRRDTVLVFVRDTKTDQYALLDWHKTLEGITTTVMGGIEQGESTEEAARREINEELAIANARFVHESPLTSEALYCASHKNENRHAIARVCLFEVDGIPSHDTVAAEETANHTIRWVSRTHVEQTLTPPHQKFCWTTLFSDAPYTDTGVLINSGDFNDLGSEEAKKKITEYVDGRMTKQYHLRDWVVSRQRFWGVPIPMIHCEKCGYNPVPEEQLPVVLPDLDDYLPTGEGKSPLAKKRDWVEVSCPKCHGSAERETDTLDTFVDSSWYFLRYTDPKNEAQFASPEKLASWMPVRLYSGGSEHTTMHVLYSRFWQKALYDIGLVTDQEPYLRRMNRGLIMGPDGQKMSKSKGNVIDPDEVVRNLGADTVRMYLAFIGPYNEVGAYPWNPNGAVGVRRFLERVWNMQEKIADTPVGDETATILNQTIAKVGEDVASLKMNTGVSALMSFTNHLAELDSVSRSAYQTLLQLLFPFAPHITSEIAEACSIDAAIFQTWPVVDESKLTHTKVIIGVQINGKTRGTVELSSNASKEEALATARADESVSKWLQGGEEVKAIYVPGRIINFVIRT